MFHEVRLPYLHQNAVVFFKAMREFGDDVTVESRTRLLRPSKFILDIHICICK